jgi:hypothetical protein
MLLNMVKGSIFFSIEVFGNKLRGRHSPGTGFNQSASDEGKIFLRRKNQNGRPSTIDISSDSVANNNATASGGTGVSSPPMTHTVVKATGPRKKQTKHATKKRFIRKCTNSESTVDTAK